MKTLPCCYCGSPIVVPAKYGHAKSAAHDQCYLFNKNLDDLLPPDPTVEAAEFPQYQEVWGMNGGVLVLDKGSLA